MKRFLLGVINLGTNDLDEDLENDVVLINSICLGGLIICLITLIISMFVGNLAYVILNVITTIVCSLTLLTNYLGKYQASMLLCTIFLPILLVLYIFQFGNMGAEYYLFVGLPLGIYFFRFSRWGIFFSIATSAISILAAKYILIARGYITLDGVGKTLYYPNLILAIVLMAYLSYLFKNLQQRQVNKLKEIHDSRGKLISVLSHDMRAPLYNLKALTEHMQLGNIVKADQEKIMSLISQSLDSTLLLLDNATHWINRESHGLIVSKVAVNIPKVLSENVQIFSTSASEKGLNIETNIAGINSLQTDPNMLNMILRNLISNAIKFTPENGRAVKINVAAGESETIISVSDGGIGMGAKTAELLEKGVRSLSQGTTKETGTSMGLILVQYFVDLLDGRIVVMSKKNEGTEISIHLNSTSSS